LWGGGYLSYIKVCDIEAVSIGELRQFNVGETEILVVNLNDQLFCLAARCTHAGAPLAEGDLRGDVLICPWHKSHFRVTDGTVIKGPAEKPLKVYRSVVKESNLFIDL
jgi:apoptosis-inducing factor 3